MDGVSAAASIAGLFQLVPASFHLWDSCRKIGSESNLILNLLKIEEARFKLWGERWSLESGTGDKFFQHFAQQPNVVLVVRDSLENLKVLFNRAKKWKERLDSPKVGEAQSQAGGSVTSIDESSQRFSFKSALRSLPGAKGNQTITTINVVKWALPGGKEDFEALISNIRETTNTLSDVTHHHVVEELLSSIVLDGARSIQEAGELAQTTSSANSLLAMMAEMRAKIMEIDLIVSQHPRTSEPIRAAGPFGSKVKQRTELQKRFTEWQEVVSKDFWEQSAAKCLSNDEVEIRTRYAHGHELVRYERSKVLRKWVEDTAIFHPAGCGLERTRKQHHERIAAVASQLHHIHCTQWKASVEPAWIRTLDCMGYFYEDVDVDIDALGFEQSEAMRYEHVPTRYDKFSYAFVLPPHLQTADRISCWTLRECHSILGIAPSAELRRTLATALARTLFGIQMAGLLHKSFNPDNILFLASGEGSADSASSTMVTLLGDPHVAGFELARPGLKFEYSIIPVEKDLYTHPKYCASTHFQTCYDVFSLGLMLLSIGLWSALESFWPVFLDDARRRFTANDEIFKSRRSEWEWHLQAFDGVDYPTASRTKFLRHHSFGLIKEEFVKFLRGKVDELPALGCEELATATKWCLGDAQTKEYGTRGFYENVVRVLDSSSLREKHEMPSATWCSL